MKGRTKGSVTWGHHAVVQLVEAAYRRGFTDGYGEAVKEEVLELQALNKKLEKEARIDAINDWIGYCDNRDGDECGHD